MASIVRALTAAGFANVSTFLASGNITFTPADDDDAASPADVETRVERVLTSLFGAPIPVVVRSMDDLERITGAITKTATATNIVLLKHALTSEQRGTLAALCTPADDLQALEKEFVWYASTKMSESPLFKLSFEKRLGASAATMRTANTLRRLLQRVTTVR